MLNALRQYLFVFRERWLAQPVSLSRDAQEDWAAQPLPKTKRAMVRELNRLYLVLQPCDHLQQRMFELEDRLPYLRLLDEVPPMPVSRRSTSALEADQFSVR